MTEKKCPVCRKGRLTAADDIISEVGGYVFVEKGERCTQCGEEFIPEREGTKMIAVARRLGIWGKPIALYRKLTKGVGGVVLRIPSDVERSLGIKGGEEVRISAFGRRICIDVAEA